MSRETDRSSSGPHGRGGSYPPGTEPYGPGATGESADAGTAPAAGSDPNAGTGEPSKDRKTETTLTTRIRINIPGSRPIPPVVMRKPVKDDESDGGLEGETSQPPAVGDARPPAAPGPASAGAPPIPGQSGAPAAPRPSDASSGEFTQETSDWFAPRKGKSPSGGSGTSGGSATAGGSGASGGRADPAASPGAGEPPYGTSDPYGVGNPYGVQDSYGSSDPYDTGAYPFARTDTPADGTPSLGGPGGGEDFSGPPRSAIHGLLDDLDTGTPAAGVPAVGGPGGPGGTGGPGGPGGPGGAPGPTTGPASGEMPLAPRPDTGSPPGEPPVSSTLGLGTGPAPFAPGAPGEEMYRPGQGSREGHGVPGDPDDDHVASDTLVGGVPRFPAAGDASAGSPFQNTGHQDGDLDVPGRATSADSDDDERSGGRSKLMLAGAGVAVLIGIAYGTGLLLDHSDVPKGTTVLGVDIGNTSRHEAVNKLDAAFGDRTTQPFTILANGKKAQLKPSVAGLTLDTEATVRKVAGRDYNPVTVIGSLFGVQREAEPALRVDEEKMASALTDISRETGDGGAPKDGMVKFVDGKAVAVPGKPHKGIDPGKAAPALEEAYRTRAATGDNSPVELPVSMQQPRIGKKELDRAIAEFGKPAMSGLVTVKAGDASIQFSPEKSLPKFLSMKPVNGTLVDTYDLPVLKNLYGTTFDGVRITRGDGSKTPVTPQDVAGALRLALKETAPSKRVQEIELNAR